jgi:hypothetical protein
MPFHRRFTVESPEPKPARETIAQQIGMKPPDPFRIMLVGRNAFCPDGSRLAWSML